MPSKWRYLEQLLLGPAGMRIFLELAILDG